MDFKSFYTKRVEELINNHSTSGSNKIFVLTDTKQLLLNETTKKYVTDIDTFGIHANDEVFSKDWFTTTFSQLNETKDYHLLSSAQFSYLINYIDKLFFKERVILLKDNIRQLFPITSDEFYEKTENENIELRPSNLPIYHIEQLKIDSNYYYSFKQFDESFETIPLFDSSIKLQGSDSQEIETIDFGADPYEIDVFMNLCIQNNDFGKDVNVKVFEKQLESQSLTKELESLNYILQSFGGSLTYFNQTGVTVEYQPKENTLNLLNKYWGKKAAFRGINIYLNPDLNNEIVEISQGLIVETIIDECNNAREGKDVRDLFLTAPTGAGKSLLFQLPAFDVSNNGDVTIVVSPLIALMKDQVEAIISDRKFSKVAYINSELSLIDRTKVLEKCHSGEIDLLYMSPELLLSYDISFFLGERKLGLLVIDEAHLITTWGRDFRVDYWFLGNHIRKIRKYSDYNFPMVAVTATAIYGGSNDMVFDSVKSLVMKNEHLFIGQVKREDILFAVSNYENFPRNYKASKLDQTAEFIKNVDELGVKTLVYTPYSSHIGKILPKVNLGENSIATGYHGGMPAEQKEYSFNQFKAGEKNTMISTKAFGMGVDISDIEVVYHHAPSGLLPDYIQEVGRAARDPKIQGIAALNYNTQDQLFSKILHGMSALRQFQLKGVLTKLHKVYLKNNKSRNLLVSVDDFGHVFENDRSLDQKVLTALMMIEKDYLAKYRFNVLIARPKKLFVKVYAKLSQGDKIVFDKKFPNTSKVLSNRQGGDVIVEIDLDKVWSSHYDNQSFPLVKRDFYKEKLFVKHGIKVIPQLKVSFERQDEYLVVFEKLQKFFEHLKSVFSNMNGFFSEETFVNELNKYFNNIETSKKMAKFLLSSYSGRLIGMGRIEPNAFLQQRQTLKGYEHRVFDNNYGVNLSNLLRRFKTLFENSDSPIVNRYLTNNDSANLINYVRLGYFMEILELGTYETKGGDKPMIFVRLNDPAKIEKDGAENSYYKNTLLDQTLERHSISSKIFDHFFLKKFSNETRWNFIEDFFLGMDLDSLLEKYVGEETSKLDIISFIKENRGEEIESEEICSVVESNIHGFPPVEKQMYWEDNLLTLEDEDGKKTMKVSNWLSDDVVLFDQNRRKYKFNIDKKLFEIMISKLRNDHFEYLKKSSRLDLYIEFNGYDRMVKASVPFNNKPVEFYKWWIKNPNKVSLKRVDIITLIDTVKKIKRDVLTKEHLKM